VKKKRKENLKKIRIVPSEIRNVVGLRDFRNFGTLKNLGLGVSKKYTKKNRPLRAGGGGGGTLGMPHPRALSYTKQPAFCGGNIVVNALPCIYIKKVNTSELYKF